jgi:predicted Zn-dependent peptidase
MIDYPLTYEEQQNPSYVLITRILGRTNRSRLNLRLREELCAVYSVSMSFPDSSELCPSITISTSTNQDSTDLVVKQALNVISEFIENGVTEKEYIRAKNQLLFEIRQMNENEILISDIVASELLFNPSFISIEDRFNKIFSVERIEAQKYVSSTFRKEPLIVITLPE